MTSRDLEPIARMKVLSDAASDFKVDNRIPIRRYFRSGQEMIKMADVYRNEGNLEAAFILYLKYITLFVEKIKIHKDYSQVLPAEKKKVNAIVRESMGITEDLKKKLKKTFAEEYDVWLQEEKIRQEEAERKEAEERARRAKIEADIESDRQVAMMHQAQIDQEERERRGLGHGAHGSIPPSYTSQMPKVDVDYDPSKYSSSATAPPPSYQDLIPDNMNSFTQPSGNVVPQYDRSAKPVSVSPAGPSNVVTSATLPSVPDRSLKPSSSSSPSDLRHVAIPGDLITRFLDIARVNSNRGIETLGTLGGQLCNNKFRVSHLLIPKQVGKSDSCTMDGLEDVWDIHDKENIIFLGWIHTHPAYSVFLSSVDMHNQYEWQHMLPEAIATVCSIKDNEVGHLRLTPSGMSEIGDCSLTNFHPHSSQPPLWEEAKHVVIENGTSVVIKDLR